jgi:uncharacterized cupin superfamily protein
VPCRNASTGIYETASTTTKGGTKGKAEGSRKGIEERAHAIINNIHDALNSLEVSKTEADINFIRWRLSGVRVVIDTEGGRP